MGACSGREAGQLAKVWGALREQEDPLCWWVPYTVHKETGKGPAWGNSLFVDNAEYGLGMELGMEQRRKQLTSAVKSALAEKEYGDNAALAAALQQ